MRPRKGQFWRRRRDSEIVEVQFRRRVGPTRAHGDNVASMVAWIGPDYTTNDGSSRSGGVMHEQDFVNTHDFIPARMTH